MRRGGVSVLVLLLLVPAPAVPAEDPPPVPVRGVLEGRTTWRGTVLVEGDVEIPGGSSLEIEAGTRVLVAESDASKSGWNSDKVEIRVAGSLLVAGTEDRPVVIGPAPGPVAATPLPESAEEDGKGKEEDLRPRYGWHGIVLLPAAGKPPVREIRGALLFDAWAGIQVPAGRLRLEGSVLLRCGTGVEAGTAFQDRDRYGVPPGVARPEILRTRFAGCLTAVGAMLRAAPRLDRCIVAHGRTGVGPRRHTGRFYPLEEPGSTLVRCDLLGNGVGVVGACLVTDSLFHRNRRALALSSFHVQHASGVDEYRLRGNVFAGNGVVLAGESLAGDVAVVKEAGYALSGEALDAAAGAPWPPLPPGFRLAEGSEARGKASGGGDPGSAAEAILRGGAGPRGTGRPPLRRPLAVRIPGGKGEGDVSLDAVPPRVGGSRGSSWWCAVEGDGAGILPLAPILGGPDAGGILAWRVKSSGTGTARLEVNGDLASFEAAWNGASVGDPVVPRRFGAEGWVAEVALRRGANLLMASVRGRGTAPRLVVALDPPAGVTLSEEAPGEAREARVLAAKVERAKGEGAWVRISLSAPVSWAAPGEVRLVDGDGDPVEAGNARVVVDQRQVLRFGPLPDALPAGTGVLLSGWRSPDGSPLETGEAGTFLTN